MDDNQNSKTTMQWDAELAQWLKDRGYVLRESGPRNPTTGHGWYSHPAEYQRKHIRVRVNLGGIIILRDPGCTIQITRPAGHGEMEFVNPNMLRLDYPHESLHAMQHSIERFESHPAFTAEAARQHFFGEPILA